MKMKKTCYRFGRPQISDAKKKKKKDEKEEVERVDVRLLERKTEHRQDKHRKRRGPDDNADSPRRQFLQVLRPNVFEVYQVSQWTGICT
jgi:hypothetical protein